MNKVILYLLLLCFICFTSCSKKEDKTETTIKPSETTTPVPSQTEKKEEPIKTAEQKNETVKKEELKEKSGAIRINIPPGSSEVFLDGKINGLKDRITYVVEAKKGQVMLTRVMAAYPEKEPNSNIRIEQIISPSGKIEGPFGAKIKYDFEESGNYKIVLSENEMVSPWKGEYKLRVIIQ
jgi:hypothetical protein